ncbi:hypothetical protein E2542_SST29162 [Spatholobus suberectus]|nr:hypothetical protein E2542_SST29162 [Spatholobus suberectus]
MKHISRISLTVVSLPLELFQALCPGKDASPSLCSDFVEEAFRIKVLNRGTPVLRLAPEATAAMDLASKLCGKIAKLEFSPLFRHFRLICRKHGIMGSNGGPCCDIGRTNGHCDIGPEGFSSNDH